jgi:peptide/nickel transport system substrate-binding protein
VGDDVSTNDGSNGTPIRGGRVAWALRPGFPPRVIFPFTPAGEFGIANLTEFQVLMFRPLYWFGRGGELGVDFDNSIGEPPEWDADGTTATVTVKPWRWSNGETVNADSVMLWMHILDVNKQHYGGYTPGFFPDNLTDYRKVGEDRVSFTFDRAYSHNWVLMNQLCLITPLPKAWDRTADGPADATHDREQARAVYEYLWDQNLDRGAFATNPLWQVVDGPWRLKSFTDDGHGVFVPNEHYSGPNKPHLDEFEQIPSANDVSEFEHLQQGPQGEGSLQVGYLPFERVTEPTTDPRKGGPNPLEDAGYHLIPRHAYGIPYFPINHNNPTVGPIFRQLYVRQALASLVDQDDAIENVYLGYGHRTDGPVPALLESELLSPRRGHELRYPFDVEEARRLLSSNGWDVSTTPGVCVNPGTGPGQAGAGIEAGARLSFVMWYAKGHPTLTRVMEKLRSDAARAGIEIELVPRVGREIAEDCVPCEPGDEKCTWQMCDWNGGWVYGPGYYPTGEFQFRTHAGVNWGNYSDPRADELIDRSVTSNDLDDLYEYQDYIAEQVPVIWMPSFPVRLLEVANGLRGVEPLNPYLMLTPEHWYYVRE